MVNDLLAIFGVSVTAMFFLWIGYEIGYKMGSSTISFDKEGDKKLEIVMEQYSK